MAGQALVIGPGGVLAPPKAAAPKGPPMAGPGVPLSSPLLNPDRPLTGQALYDAAKALASAQTAGPMSDIARQIGSNQRQTAGAQGLTSQYFGQLLPYAQQAVTDQQSIGEKLAQQLQGIGANSQSAIGAAYAPSAQLTNLAAQGLGAGSDAMLVADRARAAGTSASNAQTAQTFGAQTSANNSGLAASNLGAYALRGQERLGQIGQAGQLRNEPLAAKQAALQAQQGALLTTDLGKLRQQELTNQFTAQGLGVKQYTAAQTAAQNQARNQLTARGQTLSAATSAANNAANNATAQRGQDLSHMDRVSAQAITQARVNAQTGAGNGKPLTTVQNNKALQGLDKILGAIPTLQQNGIKDRTGKVINPRPSPADVRALLINSGYPQFMIDAAYQLMNGGQVSASTARQMHAAGIRGGSYKGQPIRVQSGSPSGSAQALGGFLSSGF